MQRILEKIWSYQENFNPVQKCLVLSICTLVVGVCLGSWYHILAFHGTLPLGYVIATRILKINSNSIGNRIKNCIDMVKTLYWKALQTWHSIFEISEEGNHGTSSADLPGLNTGTPEIEVNSCLRYIKRDFVESWYSHVSDDENFTEEVEEILGSVAMMLVERVSEVDLHEALPSYVVLIRRHIIDYQTAQQNLIMQPHFRRKRDRTFEFKKVNTIVESFSRLGKFHIAVKNDRQLELLYLNTLVDAILKVLLQADLYSCNAAKELIADILTCQIFAKVIDLLSDPHFLHKAMVIILSDEELHELSSQTERNDTENKTDVQQHRHNSNIAVNAGSAKTVDEKISESLTSGSTNVMKPPVLTVSDNKESKSKLSNEDTENSQTTVEKGGQIDTKTHLNSEEKSQSEASNGRRSENLPILDMSEIPSISTSHSNSSPGSAKQTMYISDALSKHFKVQSTDVLMVASNQATDVQSCVLSPEERNSSGLGSIHSASISNENEPISSSAQRRSIRQSLPDLKLRLHIPDNFPSTQSDSGTSDADELSAEINFKPSFFIPSDDDMSVLSDCSTQSGSENNTHEVPPTETVDVSRTRQPACLASSTPSPLDVNDEQMTKSKDPAKVTEAESPDDLPDGVGVTSQPVAPTFVSTTVSDLPIQTTLTGPRQNGHIRTNSVDFSGPSFSTVPIQPQRPGLRRVATTDAIFRHSGAPVMSAGSLTQQQHKKKTKPSLRRLAPSLQVSGEDVTSEGPVEATSTEMPEYFFQDLHIPCAEKTADSAGTIYTVYSIKFKAWHQEPESDTWELRAGIAKRRYREFVTLQERLEEHPIYKKRIKDIKGPQRWKVLPIGQIEFYGVEARRKFLQGYLQTLITRDQVANSLAVREFLAYEGDARIAFVKKAPQGPRLHKVIVRTVSEMIDKITTRSAPPAAETLARRRPSGFMPHDTKRRDLRDGAQLLDVDDLMLNFCFSHSDQKEVHTFENVLSRHIHHQELLSTVEFYTFHETPPASCVPSESEDEEGFRDAIETDPLPLESDQINQENVPPVTERGKRSEVEAMALTFAVLDLAVQLVEGRNSWIVRDQVMTFLKVLAGESLESFLSESVSDLTTRERWAHYLRLLSELLWPCGQLDASISPPETEEQVSQIKAQARHCLYTFFPSFLPFLVGEEDYDFAIDHVMEVIQEPLLNRHLVFCLLDAVVETLFPEISTIKLQNQVLSTTSQCKS